MKTFLYTALCLFFSLPAISQLKSPREFLGYEVGAQFTPHHRLVAYFEHVARESSQTVRLEKYGETNEGRPLYLAFVSAPDHIQTLETVRTNNLALTKQAQTAGNHPVIVWFSFNVHGNEASSSEASMLTVYHLAKQESAEVKNWLQNALVVIDPCLNPDGRDRYVNWYRSVVGSSMNPNIQAREHDEPWPGGRSNHYYFDLNRDWAWQTQTESRQRLKQYNRWLPQVHVDFHEQGIQSPYYFAPASKPYHEVLTPWQRDFQVTIGRNNAKHFDKNQWLYFTKEIFDLFYPSYGDTYPLYSGAIGMTYEQAGSGAAGLGVITAERDTLTLQQRALHHFTAGMSTLEVSAQNRLPLLQEFHSYFRRSQAGEHSKFGAFVIKYRTGDEQRLRALRNLLDKNQIEYGTYSGSVKAQNYHTGAQEQIQIGREDLVISTAQTRGVLAHVLFEPQSKLEDSVTYDITAWSLPYAYGLHAFATTQKLKVDPWVEQAAYAGVATNAYAIAFDWQGVASAKTAAALLRQGVRLRYTLTPFTIGAASLNRGAVIITPNGNQQFGIRLTAIVDSIAQENNVHTVSLASGYADSGLDLGSSSVKFLDPPKIALLTGSGVSSTALGDVWHFLDQTLQYPVTLIQKDKFNQIDWNEYNVLVLPNGNYDFLKDEKQVEPLLAWIRKGGKLIAFEGAVKAIADQKWSQLNEKADSTTAEKTNDYSKLKRYENREDDYVSSHTPGAIFKVEVDNSHPLMFGLSNTYYTLKQDDALYAFLDKGWNVGVIRKESAMAGFVGHRLLPRLQDALIFGVEEMGRGQIVYLTDNVLFRNFWENGKLIFCNAVFH